jgi:hypothetical protein
VEEAAAALSNRSFRKVCGFGVVGLARGDYQAAVAVGRFGKYARPAVRGSEDDSVIYSFELADEALLRDITSSAMHCRRGHAGRGQ